MLHNSESQYGVVQRMREIREEISAITMHMTFEERKAYYRKEIPEFYEELKKQNERNNNN